MGISNVLKHLVSIVFDLANLADCLLILEDINYYFILVLVVHIDEVAPALVFAC